MTRTGSPSKRLPGLHLIVTEAQTLDEALDVLRHRQRRRSEHRPPSLKQQFARARSRTLFCPITLSDRVVSSKVRPQRRAVRVEPWSRERVIEAHRTGAFKIGELAKHAQVHPLQVWLWIKGPDWKPIQWKCGGCGKEVSNTPAAEAAKIGDDPTCRHCGAPWYSAFSSPRKKGRSCS